jgi:lysophospholipase L1-like esterase
MWKALFAAALAAAPMATQAQVTKGPDTVVDSISYSPIGILPMHIGGKVRKDKVGYSYQWPGVYFEATFQSPFVNLLFDDSANNFNVIVDGKPVMIVRKPGHRTISIGAEGPGPHTIRLEKRSETQDATGHFQGFLAEPAAPAPIRTRQIEFIGDSLIVGYGNTSAFKDCTPDDIFETTDAQEGFGPLTAKHFDADYQINAFSGLGMVRNYDGREHARYHMPMLYPRAIFDDPQPAFEPGWHPQAIVVGIGGNDFSTDLHAGEPWATPEALAADYQKTYVAFVQRLRADNPTAQIILFWHDDNATYAANAQKVFDALRASGMTNIDSLVLPKLADTGCNGHPNIRDDARIAGLLIAWFDAHPQVWLGK